MSLHLLDSDSIIDFFAGFATTISLFDRLVAQGDKLSVCDIVLAEVYSGFSPADRNRREPFLTALEFLPTSSAAARQAGEWRYIYARQGRALPTTDCLIAAVAHAHHATLVTGNIRHFPMEGIVILPLPRTRRGGQ